MDNKYIYIFYIYILYIYIYRERERVCKYVSNIAWNILTLKIILYLSEIQI